MATTSTGEGPEKTHEQGDIQLEMESFSASDLPIDQEGRIYHLQIAPEAIAPDILLVGDPGRAQIIGSEFLSDLELEHEHRGLLTVTGTNVVTSDRATIISPIKTSAVTSGMGTSSLEIVVQELVALNEIDLKTRTRKTEFSPLNIIRVGTSGGLQKTTPLGTAVITSYAIGMDNTGLFYETPHSDPHCARLEQELHQVIKSAMSPKSRFYGKIHPYVSRTAPEVQNALRRAATSFGINATFGLTVSNSGFFCNQGRDIARVKPSVPDIDLVLSEFDPKIPGQRIENMEMESSFLAHFLGGLGYNSGAICPAIANRREETFDNNYLDSVRNATNIALKALHNLRQQEPL